MLGDLVEKALSSVGITKERVESWLGRPCGCQVRREKLNALGAWVQQVLTGKVADGDKHLERIMGDD